MITSFSFSFSLQGDFSFSFSFRRRKRLISVNDDFDCNLVIVTKTTLVYWPEVVSSTEKQVGAGEQSRPNFTKTTVTARTSQAVLVPAAVKSTKQVSLGDRQPAPRTQLSLDRRTVPRRRCRRRHRSCGRWRWRQRWRNYFRRSRSRWCGRVFCHVGRRIQRCKQ